MLFSLFLSTQIICIASEIHNEPGVDKSNQNSSQQIWHSYTFNTGSGNREELHFSRVGLDTNFASVDGVFMWKSLHMQKEVVILGLGNNYLLVTTYKNENDSYTYREEIKGLPRSLSVFQKWDAKTQEIKNFVVVAAYSTNKNYLLKWYEVKNKHLEFLWDWPFHQTVSHIDVIKLNNEHKLLVINHNEGISKNPSADIYSFNIYSYLDIWLFEKIILDDIPVSVSFINNNDNTFFLASFPSLETIHIFKYSKSCVETSEEQKHFISHQKISFVGLKSLTSFRVGFHWYLAIASKHSSIFHMKEDNLFYPISNLNLGILNFCLAIPVDTYREDTILLCDSGSDVSIITWKGNENLQVTGSFTQLACNDDINCLEKMHKVSLKDSTAFSYDSHQNILISTESGKPLLFMLVVRLRPLPDKVMLKLSEILKTKSIVEENYKNQIEQIEGLMTIKKDTLEKSMENNKEVFVTSTDRSLSDIEPDSHTKNWSEVLYTVNSLKTKVVSLSDSLKNLKSYLESNASHHGRVPGEVLPKNSTGGITFFGSILISELHVSTVNGYDMNNLLRNSYRKNTMKKIGGVKTLKNLNAQNIMFEKIGKTLACDIIHSDDLWEVDNRNIINGDIMFNGNLNILGDFELFSEDSTSSHKTSSRMFNHYEQLNFEELEVTNDTYIQRSINGQPFILPFHNGHLSIHYLDSINQARIEHVNVKNDLDVSFINGKNFSQLVQQMLHKSNPQDWLLDSLKIEGIFSTQALQALQLNSFGLEKKMISPKLKELSNNSSSNTYMKEENKKSARSQSLKRSIHVFNNVEINGSLFTERINNITWEFLNDTVKKDEPEVMLSSVKNFKNQLKTNKVNLRGTLNGRFVDNILTNFSDQLIRFPQVFDKVTFKNLSLKGSWDGICPKCLNDSIVRLSLSQTYASNLIFGEECLLLTLGLNVTNTLNNVSVKGGELIKRKGFSNDSIELKSIKASRVILNGSLKTNNKINNISLIDFESQRVSLNNSERIKQDVSRNTMSVIGNLNLFSLNNNDISSIISLGGDTKMIDNFLNGRINKIKKLLVNGNVTTLEGINGFNLSKVFEKGLCIKKTGSITGNVTFENIVHFNDINITNSIEGFSLKELEKDIVVKHNRVFLNGAKIFSTLIVTNDMKARALNSHFVQDIVSLKGDQSMKDMVIVNGNVIVQGNVTSYGRINDVPLPDLLKRFSTQSNSYVWAGDLKFQNELITVDNLMVGGSIQNKSFGTIIKDSVLKEDSFNIKGKKSFKGEVKFNKNVVVDDKVYGLNFSKFLTDVVFINKPEKLDGVLIVKEAVLKDLIIADYFNSSLINNFDVTEWFDESIPLNRHEYVSGKKNFEKVRALQNVKIDFINGHLPSATISLKDQQYIPSLALFPRLHSASDLSVAGFVNERNLIREYEDSVLVTGTQTIDSCTIFEKEFVVNGKLFIDTIKGRKVNNLLTLDTDQTVKTPLVFSGSVTARRGVENLQIVNGIILDEWNQKSVSLNREQVLNGLWTVKGKVKTKNIEGEGLLNAVSLPDVSKDVRRGRVMAFKTKNETESEFDAQCNKVKELSQQLIKLPYLFQQFEIVHEIETSLIIDSVITFKISNDNYLIVTFLNECRSSFYKWDKDNATFSYLRQINIGSVSKWLVTYSFKNTYLITSSHKKSVSCEENLQQGNIWVFKETSDRYVHLLTTTSFTDIIQENNTSQSFFTLDEKGDLYKWTLQNGIDVKSNIIDNVGQGNYRFLDFGVTNGLAVTNGREIKQIKILEGKAEQKSHSFPNTNIVSLPINGKNLIALVLRDKIVIYESNLGEKIFSVIHTYKASSLLWFNYGLEKQAFLIISSHHKLIEVYEYKSVSGLLKRMSVQMYSSQLQSVSLPFANKYQLNKFLIVVQRKKILFLEADMMGDYFPGGETLC